MTEQDEQFDPMCIQTAAGSRVVFMARNGYEGERAQALRILTVGAVYEVTSMDVGNFSSSVTLKGIPGYFNASMFKNTSAEFETYNWFEDNYPSFEKIQETIASIEPAPELAPTTIAPPVTFTVRTSCRGQQQQTTINQTEQESVDSFMAEFGEEPEEFITIYTSGAFNPKDIQGRTTSYHCHCDH